MTWATAACRSPLKKVQTDAVLLQVLQHFSGAVFDLVFQQKGRLKTALITQENNAARVVDMGKCFR